MRSNDRPVIDRARSRQAGVHHVEATPHTILFTGHRIDTPGRAKPRFPPDKEQLARKAIRDAVEREVADHGKSVGIAGGASGGDILFHEVCAELGVPTTLWLALPPDRYVMESVAPAGPDWVPRFHLVQASASSVRLFAPPIDSSSARPYGSIFEESDLSMLHEAFDAGIQNMTLIALWNGKTAGIPGEIADMVRITRDRGVRIVTLDSDRLFGLGTSLA